jgi:hypothetical protein
MVGSLGHCRHSWYRLKVVLTEVFFLCLVFVPGLLCLSFLLEILDNNFQVVVIQPSLSEVVTTFTLRCVLVVRPCTRGYGVRREPKETWGDNLTVDLIERQGLTVHVYAGSSSKTLVVR